MKRRIKNKIPRCEACGLKIVSAKDLTHSCLEVLQVRLAKAPKKISTKALRTVFLQMAPAESVMLRHHCKSLLRVRFWNYFRLGVRLGQTGKISASDVRHLHRCPTIKPCCTLKSRRGVRI